MTGLGAAWVTVKKQPTSRAVNPNPHSLFLLDPAPDPEGKKLKKIIEKCKEIGNNSNFI